MIIVVQPVDYGGVYGKDPKVKSVLDEITRLFPKYTQSDDYEIYQGIIISKNENYNGQSISVEKMGEILGYRSKNLYKEL